MSMKGYVCLCMAVLLAVSSNAQSTRRCANDEILTKMAQVYPGMEEAMQKQRQEFLQTVAAYSSGITAQKTTAQVTIPVVFHIVLNQAQLISIGGAAGVALRVDSQMAVLNRDYNGQGLDQSSIPAVFQPLYGNAQIRFGLAHTKPDGSSTDGYEIITTTKSGFSAMSGTMGSAYAASDAKYQASDGADAWDPDKYLNIWIVNFTESGLLGISPPMSWTLGMGGFSFPKEEVGPAVNYRAFGKSGPGQTAFLSGYNGGRTLVHEMGHFFEMYHIWGNTAVGSGTCSDDDGIADTPVQEDANSGCPSFPKANCTNTTGGEMFMNFMDYVEDACYRMFTNQQVDVMNFSASDPSGYAYSLSQNPHLLQWPAGVKNMMSENAFYIFPNPSQGVFRISIAENELEKVMVTNALGQAVKNINVTDKHVKNYDVDLTGMNKGIYHVQCIFARGTLTKKIVLQ